MNEVPQPILLRSVCALAMALAPLATGCAKPEAVMVAIPPPPAPLDMPVPPPRIIVPPQPDEVEVTAAEPPPAPVRPRARPTPKPEPKTDTAPAEASPGEPPPSEGDGGTPAPSLELRRRNEPDEGAIRQQLAQANQTLSQVHYANLSSDLKAQYETAQRFITLGGQALKEQNVLFAATLADKAGAIARLLSQR